MHFVRIFLLVSLATLGYGLIHDQVTARVCLEYFSIAHPFLIDSDSPTIVGLAWGVTATWRIAIILEVAAGLVSQVGPWPRFSASQLVRPVGYLVTIIGVASICGGVAAYVLSELEFIHLTEPAATAIERSSQIAFLGDRWAHRVAHGVGILGAGVLCSTIWVTRKRAGERPKVS
jgi:hypothetical protein